MQMMLLRRAGLTISLMTLILALLSSCGNQFDPTSSNEPLTLPNPGQPTNTQPFVPDTTAPTSAPWPTDTEYRGIEVDYTRMPGHYIKKGKDFGIATYTSPRDKDADGVDDQTDIFLGAKAYLAQRPIYNASSYYSGGYPKVNEKGELQGVCTDVVAAGLVAAGYDLKALVDADIEKHPEYYTSDLAAAGFGALDSFTIGEKNIDFRRVRNLYAFFEHHAEKLTLDLKDTAAWQPGDIVIFFGSSGLWNGHIVVLSDRRADDGVPYVLHHAATGQTLYEEDYLVSTTKRIVGHYRWNGFNGE